MNGSTYQYAYWTLSPGNSTVLHLTGGTIHYFHKDWLGSSRISSLGDATIIDDRAFAPFGELYNNFGAANANELLFTGDTANTVGGWLYDTANRNLHPSQGRWLSPDPAGAGWNEYAYVENSPLSYVDPLGLNQDACKPNTQCGNAPGSTSDGNPLDPMGNGSIWSGALSGFIVTQYDFSASAYFHWSDYTLSDLLRLADRVRSVLTP